VPGLLKHDLRRSAARHTVFDRDHIMVTNMVAIGPADLKPAVQVVRIPDTDD
jgi:hypothetical protein